MQHACTVFTAWTWTVECLADGLTWPTSTSCEWYVATACLHTCSSVCACVGWDRRRGELSLLQWIWSLFSLPSSGLQQDSLWSSSSQYQLSQERELCSSTQHFQVCEGAEAQVMDSHRQGKPLPFTQLHDSISSL